MKKITKYLGLMAMLPLLAVTLSSLYIDEAEAAQVEQTYLNNRSGEPAYDVKFDIYAGEEGLEAGKLLVTSDKASKEVLFSSVRPGLHTSVALHIVADDPDSITASIVEQPTETKPIEKVNGKDSSWIELNRVIHERHGSYKVSYIIHAGNEDLTPGEIMVTTDITSKIVPYGHVYAGQFTSAVVLIPADDLGSITPSFYQSNSGANFGKYNR